MGVRNRRSEALDQTDEKKKDRETMSNLYQRNGIFWARFKVCGVSYRFSLRTRSEATAKKRLKVEMERVMDQAHFAISGPVSWKAAVVSWEADATASRSVSEKTLDRYRTSLIQCREWLDDKELSGIDTALIRDLVKGRQRQGCTNATVRRDLTAISSVLDHAIEEKWIEENAARSFNRKRVPERRDPILLPTDDDILYTLGRDHTRFVDIILFARETGMRQEEIASLEHGMVDKKAKVITFIGKRRKLRAIPLTAKALKIIEMQPRYLGCDFVFYRMSEDAEGKPLALRYSNLASNFGAYTARAEKRAKKAQRPYRRFRFHDLRHLFAVDYLRRGIGGIYDLQKVLGHTSIKTTEVYLDYLTPEEARTAQMGVAQKRTQM